MKSSNLPWRKLEMLIEIARISNWCFSFSIPSCAYSHSVPVYLTGGKDLLQEIKTYSIIHFSAWLFKDPIMAPFPFIEFIPSWKWNCWPVKLPDTHGTLSDKYALSISIVQISTSDIFSEMLNIKWKPCYACRYIIYLITTNDVYIVAIAIIS